MRRGEGLAVPPCFAQKARLSAPISRAHAASAEARGRPWARCSQNAFSRGVSLLGENSTLTLPVTAGCIFHYNYYSAWAAGCQVNVFAGRRALPAIDIQPCFPEMSLKPSPSTSWALMAIMNAWESQEETIRRRRMTSKRLTTHSSTSVSWPLYRPRPYSPVTPRSSCPSAD